MNKTPSDYASSSLPPKRDRSREITLPPTPKLRDPDLQALIKRFPVVPSTMQQNEENIKFLSANKSKVHKLIKQCFRYESDEEIPFKLKYDYRMFLENYYQSKFKETLEIVKQMENIDTKLAKQFYSYSMLKIQEGLIQADEIIKEYKSGLADPCRYAAMYEKMLTTKSGRTNKRSSNK